MTGYPVFLAGLFATVILSVLTVLFLRPHLDTILTELCGTHERARFWSAFSVVTLVLTPLLFALLISPDDVEPVFSLTSLIAQLRLALLGLLITAVVLALVLSRFIPKLPPPASGAAKPDSVGAN